MQKRAILYARVSTDEQANNYSLPTQLEACRAYAQQHDCELTVSKLSATQPQIPALRTLRSLRCNEGEKSPPF